jgi:hypothetical protein
MKEEEIEVAGDMIRWIVIWKAIQSETISEIIRLKPALDGTKIASK